MSKSKIIPETTARNIFLAVFPDPVVAAWLSEQAHRIKEKYSLDGKPLKPELFHVTLLFLGEEGALSPEFLTTITEAMETVKAPPFDVCFDKASSFPGKENARKPLVLSPSDGAKELHSFRSHIDYALTMRGISERRQTRYVPHITLLYDRAAVEEVPVDPVCWTVREFALVRSYIGEGRYECIAKWPLC